MKKIMKRCCSFLIGLTLASSLVQGTVYAAKDTKTVVTPSNIAVNDIEGKVDSFMKDYIGESVPGAVVIAVKDDKVIFEKAYGESNKEEKKAISTKDTTFELGSLTKMYTWIAVMQQVEAGKIDLNADIFTYLPDDFKDKFKDKLISDQPITMMHLINNTAGFEETGFNITLADTKELDTTLYDALINTMPMQIYEPGQVMTGSSYCSALAGYIVQCVTGTEFSTYVAKNIFETTGMTSSTILADTKIAAEINNKKAIPYGLGDNGTFHQVDYMYSNLYPSAALVTNGDDLAKLIKTFVQKKPSLLKTETIKEMFKPTYAINENAKGQCLGFYEYPSDSVKAYYHDGTSNGYSSMMTVVPDSDFGVGILSNSSISTEFMYGLTNLLISDETKEMPKQEVTQENMPSMDGFVKNSFTGAKRSYNNMLEFVGYFGNCSSFKKGDDDTLVIDTHKYKQIKPYVFEYAGSTGDQESSILTKTVAKYIYFGHNENGEITKWSYGGSGAGEFVADKDVSAQSNLSLSVLVIMLAGLLCAIMFSTNIILTAIDWIHKKPVLNTPKGAFRISTFLFIALTLNVVTEVTGLLETTLLNAKTFYWNTVGNYALVIAIIASFGYFIYCYGKEKPKPIKLVLYGMEYAFMTLFIYLMITWKFFVFV